MCNLRFLTLLAWCLCADTLVHNKLLAQADPPPRLPPIPGNDDFANGTPLVGEPLAQPVYLTGATFEPFESGWTWFGSEAGSVWWSWVAPRSGAVTVTLLDEVSRAGGYPGATPDVQSACAITVSEGTTPTELIIDAQASSYRRPLFAQTTFQAVGGATYQIQTASESAPNAAFVLRLAYDVAPEIVLSQPILNAQFLAGETIPFAARCLDPDGGISNVWFRVASQYNEWPQTWWIAHPPFATNWTPTIPDRYRLQAIVEDVAGALREAVPVEFEVRPVNDAFANRTPLLGDSIDTTAWVQNATSEAFATVGNWTDIWWRWTAPRSGPFTLVVDETPGYYPRVDIFTGSTLPTLVTVASNIYNGWFGVPYETSATFDAVAGVEYAIEVSSSAQCSLHGV